MNKFLPNSFDALFVKKDNLGNYSLSVEKNTISKIDNNEVIIKVLYSSLNYKDMLICSGNPGLVRKYPHIPGIDAAGIIVNSKSKKFKKDDKVMIVAQPLGVRSNGGLAQYIKVQSDWVEKIPKNFSIKNSMIFGTAGFTASLAAMTLLKNGLKKSKKPILISGATGGVGIIAIYILSKLGFSISAVTTKKKEKFLKKMGATEVISYDQLNCFSNLPLLKIKYSAIIDNVGGNIIKFSSKQLDNNGKILSVGIASGDSVEISIMPFILRGIQLIGINSENSIPSLRKKIWKNIVKFSKDKKLQNIYKECNLKDVPKIIKKIKLNKNIGRYIVKMD